MIRFLGELLFVAAMIGNLVVIAVGLLAAIAISIGRAVSASEEAEEFAPAHGDAQLVPEPARPSLFKRVLTARATLGVFIVVPIAVALVFGHHEAKRASVVPHFFGELLFVAAVIGNLALIAAGLLAAIAVSIRRAASGTHDDAAAPARGAMAAFHHPDPVRTSFIEKAFMTAATLLVLVGLPVALAFVFQLVVPLIGQSWAP